MNQNLVNDPTTTTMAPPRCEKHRLHQVGQYGCPLCNSQTNTEKTAAIMRPLLRDDVYVKVSPGELFDRLTILWVKRDRLPSGGSKHKQVMKDIDELETWIWGTPGSSAQAAADLPFWSAVTALYRTNSQLWVNEDEIRRRDRNIFPLDPDPSSSMKPGEAEEYIEQLCEYASLARSIYVLNDERSQFKNAINNACGHAGEPKHYEEYDRD